MLQRTCSGSLYAVLEVARDATPQEIKKAYHRLALRLHPDKTGGTTTEQFTLIQEAQSILSDPRQRRVYDTFGRMGIESLRQFGDGMVMITTAGIHCAFITIAFWMLLWLLTLVLVIVRLDYNKGWPWAAVFAPAWVAFVPLLLIGGLLVFHGITKREITSTLLGFMCFLVTFAVVMFVLGLSGSLKWTIALAPSVAIYVIQSCFILRYLLPSQFRNGFAEFIPPGSSVCLSRMYWGFLLETVFEKLCGFSFIILAMLRAAQKGGEDTSKLISFWIVFTPVIAYFGCMMFVSAARRFFAETVEGESRLLSRLCHALAAAMSYASLLFMTCMLAAKCEAEINHKAVSLHPSAAVTLLPLEVALSLAVLLPSCIFCNAEFLFGDLSAMDATEDGENFAPGGDDAFDRRGFMHKFMRNDYAKSGGRGENAAESPEAYRGEWAPDPPYLKTSYQGV
ncbi:heat shock protein, putative [Trypanosoma cruzi marinkellei]|uniref:Heat shock protein, putative n=1 Tax=Trypanosoma cruzi marinkellei TaxID=85056 RepID=K2NN44_TRYCR|nr:heat shock protein, putative [Trypanosoma cruzi marinkellei]